MANQPGKVHCFQVQGNAIARILHGAIRAPPPFGEGTGVGKAWSSSAVLRRCHGAGPTLGDPASPSRVLSGVSRYVAAGTRPARQTSTPVYYTLFVQWVPPSGTHLAAGLLITARPPPVWMPGAPFRTGGQFSWSRRQ